VIRVVIADDHQLVRQGIRMLLGKAEDIEVVGEAENGYEAVDLVERLKPDVLVMDVAMPELNGTQAMGRLLDSSSTTQVVILSMYSDESLVRQSFQNGAKGYLLKNSAPEELLSAVRTAHRGQIYLSPLISEVALEDISLSENISPTLTFLDRLSSREREVLQLVGEGYTNGTIAQMLHISIKTVEKHRASIMIKLDVHDSIGMLRIAIKHGLIFLDK
jgi:DNA-binding NarL/FixJ family response regulator